jgi:TRAP-type C4-dicarboxylate transport system permease small subunit
MAGEASVITDDSYLSRLDRGLYKLESILIIVSGLAVFSLMLLAVVSVGGRNLFGRPLTGYVDWIEQVMPFIAFLGIAYTQRIGGHIRMDMFINKLSPRLLWLVEFVSAFMMLLLIVLLIYGSSSHFLRSFDFAANLWSRDSSMDIALPLWPAKFLVPFSLTVLALRLLIQLYGYGAAFVGNKAKPAAVPLIENAALQAANEAKTVSEEVVQ